MMPTLILHILKKKNSYFAVLAHILYFLGYIINPFSIKFYQLQLFSIGLFKDYFFDEKNIANFYDYSRLGTLKDQ